jgi:protein gp37
MGEATTIQWTDHTFNPWRGCVKVSPGCANCYAERQSKRNPRVLGVWGQDGTRVLAADATWREPVRWDDDAGGTRPGLVFCASLADVFEDWGGQLTDSSGRPLWLAESSPGGLYSGEPDAGDSPCTLDHARSWLWALIRATPNLRWQLLTKRPQNIARMMPPGEWPNVWLGVSVEGQEWAWRVDALQDARGSVRVPVGFVSAEPLLGPLDLAGQLAGGVVQWLIVGGESGSGARGMEMGWARALVEGCHSAGVPVFVKQLGHQPRWGREEVPGPGFRPYAVPLVHDPLKGGDMRDWPETLRVRQMPRGWPG